MKRFFLSLLSMAVLLPELNVQENLSFAQDPETIVSRALGGSLKNKRHEKTSPERRAIEGKIIRSVTVKVLDVFEGENLNAVFRTANKLKANTREVVIRRELLFKEGDRFDDFAVRESERRLRDLGYLRSAEIIPKVDGEFVDLEVRTQDTWTFIPEFSYSSSAGKNNKSAVITENDLLGLGKRIEFGYEEREKRQILQGIYDDNRFLGSELRLLAAAFERSDGHRDVLFFGKPFRTLFDERGWFINVDTADTVGRLFEFGEENYIFRQRNDNLNARYTVARGDPEVSVRRYSVGYSYERDRFGQAKDKDYSDLDLDPALVSNDPTRLPSNRRFSGPVVALEQINPEYISPNYIDRFERVQDYNLGKHWDANAFFASDFLGSRRNALMLNADRSGGYQFSRGAFIRGEVGIASRLESSGFRNSLARGEVKYYNVLGDLTAGDLFLGKHTFASSFFIDYGGRLDADRQFSLGGDSGLRGYRARAFNGDKRFNLNVEDRVHFIDDLFSLVSLGGAAFIDVGGASYSAWENLVRGEVYSDVGVGLRFAFPRSTGGRVFRVDLALPLRSAQDDTSSFQLRLSVGGGQEFSSQLRSENFGPERANVAVGFDR